MVLACVYHIAILVGFKYTEFLTGRRGGGGLGSAGAELFYLPAAVVAEGGLYRGICPRAGGFPSALRAVFPHRYLRPHSAARESFFPQLREKGFLHPDWSDAAAGIYAICCGTIKKVLLADAFGTVVNNGWVHLEELQRSGGLAGDFGVYAPAVL